MISFEIIIYAFHVYICTYISVYTPSSIYLMFLFCMHIQTDYVTLENHMLSETSEHDTQLSLSTYCYINISLHQSAKLLKNSTF